MPVAGRETIQLESFRVGALSLAGFLVMDGHRVTWALPLWEHPEVVRESATSRLLCRFLSSHSGSDVDSAL